MAVNTRTEYALRALLEMPEKNKGSISAQQICVNEHLPKKYVEHLLGSLKKAGLIQSSAGSKGGYSLTRTLSQISLLDVMQAVEDSALELDCSMGGQFCTGEKCSLKGYFADLAEQQREIFAASTLDRINTCQRKERV